MKKIHVAVGVIVNDNNEVLLAKRPLHLHQGGLWEFPGGKIEAGETVQQALKRELHEELNIIVQNAIPFISIEHAFTDKTVVLEVYKVDQFTGEAIGREGQEICWMPQTDLHTLEFPKPNYKIIELLQNLVIPTKAEI